MPVDSITKPNKALAHIPERGVVTNSGKVLTLMNPAFMMRELNEFFAEFYGISDHIISKKLLRTENKPDDWKINALNEFEKGIDEVSGFAIIN